MVVSISPARWQCVLIQTRQTCVDYQCVRSITFERATCTCWMSHPAKSLHLFFFSGFHFWGRHFQGHLEHGRVPAIWGRAPGGADFWRHSWKCFCSYSDNFQRLQCHYERPSERNLSGFCQKTDHLHWQLPVQVRHLLSMQPQSHSSLLVISTEVWPWLVSLMRVIMKEQLARLPQRISNAFVQLSPSVVDLVPPSSFESKFIHFLVPPC